MAVLSSPAEPSAKQAEATDRQLFDRFLAGDESAFTALVERHASLVMGVCRRVLRDSGEADDAFQATFLVLARKARSLDGRESVAGWLHQTARRTALKLRGLAARRAEIEALAVRDHHEATPATEASVREVAAILDAELAALPARFREAILLSQVEGLTRDEVALRLGISSAAVKDRLERGREALRLRLCRRGVTLSAAALAAWISTATTSPAALGALAATTAGAAVKFSAGTAVAGSVLPATSLAQGVLKMMGLEKLKSVMVCITSVVAAGGIAYGMLRDEPARFATGICGQIVAMNLAAEPPTVTIALEESGALLNLDIAPQATVRFAFEAGKLGDVKIGQRASLRLADDHRKVREIHVAGTLDEVTIRSVEPDGRITVVGDDGDDDNQAPQPPRPLTLAPDAILRIGGLPATRADLAPGMRVPLELAANGATINAIEADPEDDLMHEGRLVGLDALTGKLVIEVEGEGEDDRPVPKELKVSPGTLVSLDGQPAKLADLKPGCGLILRTARDRTTVQAIRASRSEEQDNGEKAPDEPEDR